MNDAGQATDGLSITPAGLRELLGGIDIYLLDQVLRGRIGPVDRILDAGCGGGRNLVWFLRAGHEVIGVDADPGAIEQVRRLAARLAPRVPDSSFRVEPIEAMGVPAGWADVVVSSAVLHFARDETHFLGMLRGSWRALRPGGLFFCRLASTIGMPEERFTPLGHGRYRVPDGTARFLVDEARLVALTEELGGDLLDPLKTTVVQDQRCMTTWVARRRQEGETR